MKLQIIYITILERDHPWFSKVGTTGAQAAWKHCSLVFSPSTQIGGANIKIHSKQFMQNGAFVLKLEYTGWSGVTHSPPQGSITSIMPNLKLLILQVMKIAHRSSKEDVISPRTGWKLGDCRKTLRKAEGSPSFTRQGDKRPRITSAISRLHPCKVPGSWIPKEFLLWNKSWDKPLFQMSPFFFREAGKISSLVGFLILKAN